MSIRPRLSWSSSKFLDVMISQARPSLAALLSTLLRPLSDDVMHDIGFLATHPFFLNDGAADMGHGVGVSDKC